MMTTVTPAIGVPAKVTIMRGGLIGRLRLR
jgi:hypothetical protein